MSTYIADAGRLLTGTYLADNRGQLIAETKAMRKSAKRVDLLSHDYLSLLSTKKSPVKRSAFLFGALIRVGAVQLAGKVLNYTRKDRLPVQIEDNAQLRAICWQELGIEISTDEADLVFAFAHVGRSQTDHERQWLANSRAAKEKAGQSEGL